MLLEYGGYSHKGMVRKSNEDYYYIPSTNKIQNLAMIADGMGDIMPGAGKSNGCGNCNRLLVPKDGQG